MNEATETKVAQVILRMDPELKAGLEKWATIEKRSNNQEAIQMLEEGIKRREEAAEL